MTDAKKVALVTGASRGIGAAVADKLGHDGFIVLGTATSESGAEKISQRFAELGISGKGYCLNVTDGASIDAVMADIQAEFGAPAGTFC